MLSDNLNLEIPLKENILWQYEDATRLQSLIESKQAWINTNFVSFGLGWLTSIFNLHTANQFGCVVWAAILNLPSSLIYNPESGRDPWGFGGGRQNFDNGNFDATHVEPAIGLEDARRILRMRYWTQTMSPTVSNINEALKDVFGDLGAAYVMVDGVMSIKYKFEFALNPLIVSAAQKYDIFPAGAGVKVSFEHL